MYLDGHTIRRNATVIIAVGIVIGVRRSTRIRIRREEKRMRIGLVDVDSHGFPNISLMKISAWHKKQGDAVEWHSPLFSGHLDRVYMSKVFSFSPDYEFAIDADEIVRGGSGYAISTVDGREQYGADPALPYDIEHTYPDYALYGITDTAYGFLTRGCPRGCPFCHVASKEGRVSHQVAELSEFYDGQRKIVLCDPNILGCRDHMRILQEVENTHAEVEFNQGIDARLLTEENVRMLNNIKMKTMHTAWDTMEQSDRVIDGLTLYSKHGRVHPHNVLVYMLTNFGTTLEEDIYRVTKIRELGFMPFTMIYDKKHSDQIHRDFARWTNNPFVLKSCPDFSQYRRGQKTYTKM